MPLEFEKNKDETVFIRMTSTMNEQLTELAKKYNVSKSEVIRTLLEDELKRIKK